MESFSITSKCCFRGLLTLPKNISWGNTEMLLCTYCIGQSPKMGNGNGFWHHCGDSGMIIILASCTFGSVSESFSLFHSLLLSWCVCVKEWKFRIPVGQMPSESPLIFHSPALLCFPALSFSAHVFAPLCSCFLLLVVWTRAVYNGWYSTWQQVRGELLSHKHYCHVPRIKYFTNCTVQAEAKTLGTLYACMSFEGRGWESGEIGKA